MIINITEYLANSLLTIFSIDLAYFEQQIPVTTEIVNILIGVGWALMIGNLVFQATKTMATGLGFEGEDPRTLFTRTFVMTFFLVFSRQICDIGLSITKDVINLLQLPTIVQVPKLTEETFSVPGDASWLLVIIVGIILVIQLIKLFFEIGERYVLVVILTILSPLAFAMGGSKNTADIFKGWVRMFASMCLMMILSVIFLKLVLSAMSVVPSGVSVIPWMIFVVAIARTGRKVDGIIARIGLNPAVTGDPLTHSRMPGMLSYMVMKNMATHMGKASAESKNEDSKKSDNTRPALTSGSLEGTVSYSETPTRPPIGAGAASSTKTIETSPSSSGGAYDSSGLGTGKTHDPLTHDVSPHTSTMTSGSDTSRPLKESGGIGGEHKGSESKTGDSKSLSSRPDMASLSSSKADTPTSSVSKGSEKDHEKSRPAMSDTKLKSPMSVATKSASTDTAKATSPIAKTPSADIPTAPKAKGSDSAEKSKADIPFVGKTSDSMPLADKIRPALSSTDKPSSSADIKGSSESVKPSKDVLSESAKASRPPTTSATDSKAKIHTPSITPKDKSDSKGETAPSRPTDASIMNKTGDISQKGGNVSQNQTNQANISMHKKDMASKHVPPTVTTAKSDHSRPPMPKLQNSTSKPLESSGATKPPLGGSQKADSQSSTKSPVEYSTYNKGASDGGATVMSKEMSMNSGTRPNLSNKNEASKLQNASSQSFKSTGTTYGSEKAASSTNNTGATSPTLVQSGISTAQPTISSKEVPSRPNIHQHSGIVQDARSLTEDSSRKGTRKDDLVSKPLNKQNNNSDKENTRPTHKLNNSLKGAEKKGGS